MRVIQLDDKEIAYELKYTHTRGIKLLYRSENPVHFEVHAAKIYSVEKIEDFLYEKKNWILKQYNKELQRDKSFMIFGKSYEVILQAGDSNRIDLFDTKVQVTQKDPDNELVTNKLVIGLWKVLLKRYIENQKSRYELVTGKKGVNFTYRLMKTRYGSCTPSKNNITLNLHLAQLPPDLIDGIVYHEYSHFKQMNHSARFYKVLSQYCPDWQEKRKRLRLYYFSTPSQCVKINAK